MGNLSQCSACLSYSCRYRLRRPWTVSLQKWSIISAKFITISTMSVGCKQLLKLVFPSYSDVMQRSLLRVGRGHLPLCTVLVPLWSLMPKNFTGNHSKLCMALVLPWEARNVRNPFYSFFFAFMLSNLVAIYKSLDFWSLQVGRYACR